MRRARSNRTALVAVVAAGALALTWSASSAPASGTTAIAWISPTSGATPPRGTTVTVSGNGFEGTTGVWFDATLSADKGAAVDGTRATAFHISSDNSIGVNVPTGAQSGPIVVCSPTGCAISPVFTILTALPTPSGWKKLLSGNAPRVNGSGATLSADGTTALAASGSSEDVFVRSSSGWKRQGALPASGNVALSADGNTALIGEDADRGQSGSAWVFTRVGATWTQQGPLLAPRDAQGAEGFGESVSLSQDGNTALIGGPTDDNIGAAWVFRRSGSKWAQQGPKLVGDDSNVGSWFGWRVALSGAGDSALISGLNDDGSRGAVWAFSRTGDGQWIQQGAKFAPASPAGLIRFGATLALAANGKVALMGGFAGREGDLNVWVYNRSANGWRQRGEPLSHGVEFGATLALTSDGHTALVADPEAVVEADTGVWIIPL